MLFRAEPPAEFQHRAVDEAVGRGVDRLLTEGATEAGPEVGSNPHALLRRETARSEALRREIERVRESNEALRAEVDGEPTAGGLEEDIADATVREQLVCRRPAEPALCL